MRLHPRAAAIAVALIVAPALSPIGAVGQDRAQLELAHPIVKGAAGPFPEVSIKIVRPTQGIGARFTVILEAPGKRIALPGPDEPADLYMLAPKAVIFTRIDRSGRNGIVILYDSSRIGPGHGTDHRALVYRVGADRAVRVAALEPQLEGAANAAAARAQIAQAIQSYRVAEPLPKISSHPKTVSFPDGTSAIVHPYKMQTPRNLSAAQCGVEIGGQSVATLGVGDLGAYTCDKLVEVGPLPSIGTSRRIGLIYEASSPNAEFMMAVVLIASETGWSVDTKTQERLDLLPETPSIKALAKALE